MFFEYLNKFVAINKSVNFFTVIKIFILLVLILVVSCIKELRKEEFLAYYESECQAHLKQGEIDFFVLPLSSDYEQAKWGVAQESGFRVLFWSRPRIDALFNRSYLVSSGDTVIAVTFRKSPVFETGNTDLFVLAFPKKMDNAHLIIEGFGNGFGNIRFPLNICKSIRLMQEQ